MQDEEDVIAEQDVAIHDQQSLRVCISRNHSEEFWRVDVTNPAITGGHVSTTVAPGDGFLMNLIEEAVGGGQVAWQHLAQWGHNSLTRHPGGVRAIFA